ncbi:MAG TPA: hypothetical protein VLW75_09235 [Rhizomicrobium sp.]|nr:hypothetical protein [Rhizomicrobium sp.]
MKTVIPYIDLRAGSPLDLLRERVDQARALVRAASRTYGPIGRAASLAALPLGDSASRAWLERAANPYREEIRKIAAIIGMKGAWLLNVCFEWGCTGGVWNGENGPMMRRVLDWPFPALGENVVVAHQKGKAGEFLNATWPGMSGVLQACAPGRFAAAINQAPGRMRGAGFAGDWVRARIDVRRTDALPPAHLLRHVFETAPDYAAARQMLCATPLAVPAIFILAGAALGEGSVIERTETGFVLHAMDESCVCATNHFEGRMSDHGRGWRPRPIDSAGRLAAARRLDGDGEDFSWFAPPIANAYSRLVMSAEPGSGALSLMGTSGAMPVTEIYRHAA